MPNLKNQQVLADLQDRLSRAQSAAFITYSGLSVPMSQALRQKITEAGGDMVVCKNTLAKLAFVNLGLPIENLEFFGQTALVFGYQDPVSPIKALFEFNKKNELPVVNGGYFEGGLLSAEAIKELSKLPGQLELRGMLASTFVAPVRNFVGVCNGALRDFVSVLDQVAKAKD